MSGKVLITGANGHLGANLTRALLRRGKAIRVLVHEPTEALDGLEVETVHGDIRDADIVDQAILGCEYVFHLAAKITILPKYRQDVHDINVGGTENITSACLKHGVKRLLHCSSVHALQQPTDGELTETQPFASMDTPPYDRSKSQGEQLVHSAVEQGLDAVIVNPCAIIGPYDYAPSRMGRVLLDMALERMPAVIDGAYTFVDVRDVADGCLRAFDNGTTGERYLLGGHHLTIRELAERVSTVTGAKAPRFSCPWWVARAIAPISDLYGVVTNTEPLFTTVSLDIIRQVPTGYAKAAKELGYMPRPFDNTLTDTFEWFQLHGMMS
ncbi:MAG: SDR family oxidoreductase [Myxococcota bacterium]|nr:SDR family oxidoreductase [Myxococcota bacterium]